ncbi:MAG: CHAD domain-containing protein [Ignavibacteriaceae bacterium]|nr:CHAD domain-containing protein [Ignavibacteriaceae bacterium]
MTDPKWRIKKLNSKISFKKATCIILNERSANLIRLIKKYLKSNTAENLHNVRISLRRLRYNMELFYDLYDRKKFLKLYIAIEKLQDTTGNVRDNYILKQNILLFGKEEQFSFLESLYVKIEEKENLLIDDLKHELSSFILSAELKNFMKIIK